MNLLNDRDEITIRRIVLSDLPDMIGEVDEEDSMFKALREAVKSVS